MKGRQTHKPCRLVPHPQRAPGFQKLRRGPFRASHTPGRGGQGPAGCCHHSPTQGRRTLTGDRVVRRPPAQAGVGGTIEGRALRLKCGHFLLGLCCPILRCKRTTAVPASQVALGTHAVSAGSWSPDALRRCWVPAMLAVVRISEMQALPTSSQGRGNGGTRDANEEEGGCRCQAHKDGSWG